MIELKDVQTVSQISKAGSIQLAASEMGLTQPALTKRLRAIEDRLGFEIFQRMSRGVKLTRLGEFFAIQGADLVNHAQDIEAEITRHRLGEEGSLRIGVRPCIQSSFFRKSLIAFSAEYPGIHLKVDTRDAHLICNAIRAGQLDFAIITTGYDDETGADPVLHPSLKFEPLLSMPVSMVVRKDHPVLSAKKPSEEILRHPIACETPPASLHRNMTKIAQKKGIPFDGPRILVDDYDFILRLVSRSNFWTTVLSENEEELSRRKQFEFLRDESLIPPMTVGVCARKSWTMPRTAKTLVDTLTSNAEAYRI